MFFRRSDNSRTGIVLSLATFPEKEIFDYIAYCTVRTKVFEVLQHRDLAGKLKDTFRQLSRV